MNKILNKPMIRAATESDYEEMDRVFRKSALALCVRDYDLKVISDWVGKPNPERFVNNAKNGCDQYVTLIDNKVVCFGEINLLQQRLQSLFVLPEFAGQGTGKEMLLYLFNKARNKGVKTLTLESSINAANFYQRHGFIETEKIQFTTQTGVILDAVKMECFLE